MKFFFLATLIISLAACSTQPNISSKFSSVDYSVVLLPRLTGDTSQYVYKQLIAAFSSNQNVRIIGLEDIKLINYAVASTATQNMSLSSLQLLAKELGAQAILIGRVKSGAMSILSSTTINSSIQLDLFDAASGEMITTASADESMLLRERRSSLEAATQDIIMQFESVFARL